jgi:hypothetical protein
LYEGIGSDGGACTGGHRVVETRQQLC